MADGNIDASKYSCGNNVNDENAEEDVKTDV